MALTGAVHVADEATIAAQNNLRVILETHLNNFVIEPKHDGMLSPHPFLYHDLCLFSRVCRRQNASVARHVHPRRASHILLPLRVALILKLISIAFQVICKVLKQEHLLLDLLWCLIYRKGLDLFLPSGCGSLGVSNCPTSCIPQHLRIVVEVDAETAVRQCIPEAVLRTVVDPSLDPDRRSALVELEAQY